MRNISDTIRRLRAYRFAAPAKFAVPPHGKAGQGNRLADLPTFGSNPGQLRARIYIPRDLREKAPLVVVLHGCTQSAATYDYHSGWSRMADQHGFAVLFPEQQRSNNPNLCFNWFLLDDIRRDSEEALSIRQMIEAMILAHGLDRQRVFVTGLSAGGAMASVMLAAYPDVFAGGAIIAGLPYGCAATIPEAFDRMRGHGFPTDAALQDMLRHASNHPGPWPSISIWHGSADHTVAVSNVDRIVAQWCGVHELSPQPTVMKSSNGRRTRIWHDSTGKALIEEHILVGMGHGTPIDTRAAAGREVAGPFMIDVGISSTLHIANSWGLTSTVDETRIEIVPDRTEMAFDFQSLQAAKPTHEPAHVSVRTGPPAKAATSIRKVIEDALRTAGLMS